MAMNVNGIVQLEDGRQLAYAEYGAAEGVPLFYFHGMPGSRLEHLEPATLVKLGIRLITLDRPGYGQSTVCPNRTVIGLSHDVTQLADRLGIDKFSVLGFSGGGPYALACAYQLPQRIAKVILCSSAGPYQEAGVADMLPAQSRALYDMVLQDADTAIAQLSGMVGSTEILMNIMEASLPGSDKHVFAEPGFRAMYQASLAECLVQGSFGVAWDLKAIGSEWGFKLREVKLPIQLWQGGEDANVSPQMGHYIAEQLPNCDAHFIENAGHYLLYGNTDLILSSVSARDL